MMDNNHDVNENSIESKEIRTNNLNSDNTNKEKDNNKVNVNKKCLTFFKEWVIPVAIAIILALSIHKFLVYSVNIPSSSMVPTLNVGDRLVVTKVYNKDKIQRGDIVVFDSRELNELVIKRVIGLPGDHIVIHDGIVNVNGNDIKEDYVKNNERYNGVFDVPEGKFFFLGDNRRNSNDARYWEQPYISADAIQGKAQIKYYPLEDFGILK